MKSYKDIFMHLLLVSTVLPMSTLLCMDFEEDFTWLETNFDSRIHITEDPDKLTIEHALDKREGYQEIASKIEGWRAFEGVEYFGTDDRQRKIKTVYYFDTANAHMLVREEITEYGGLLKQKAEEVITSNKEKKVESKSSKHNFLWTTTKILGGSLLVGLLIYGIKKLYDRKTQRAF
jgi:hypothetical protein